MTTDTTVNVDEIDAALADAEPKLAEDERRLAVAVYRLLATGQPVTIEQAAAATGLPAEQVAQTLHSWLAVFRDDKDRVIGFWGLALQPMPHRLRIAGTEVGAWCAWDPLFLALIVGDIDVATDDPVTGETITYRIGREGAITELSHPTSALSFLRSDQPWDDNVMATFCHFVLHFAGPDSARSWTAKHPGTFVIDLAGAVDLARRHVVRTFDAAVLDA